MMKTSKSRNKVNFEDYYPFDKEAPILGPDVAFNTKENVIQIVESVREQTTEHWMRYFKAILEDSDECMVCAEHGVRQVVERLLVGK